MFRAWLIPSIIPCELWRLKVLPTKAWSFQRQARNEENPSLKTLKTTALKISISVLQAISFQIIFFPIQRLWGFALLCFQSMFLIIKYTEIVQLGTELLHFRWNTRPPWPKLLLPYLWPSFLPRTVKIVFFCLNGYSFCWCYWYFILLILLNKLFYHRLS